jgi:hypothetical protein
MNARTQSKRRGVTVTCPGLFRIRNILVPRCLYRMFFLWMLNMGITYTVLFASRIPVLQGVSYVECPTSIFSVCLLGMTYLRLFYMRNVVILACFELGIFRIPNDLREDLPHLKCHYLGMVRNRDSLILGCLTFGMHLSRDVVHSDDLSSGNFESRMSLSRYVLFLP